MRIIRVYSGDDGESHFEDLTLEQLGDLVNRPGEGPINLGQRPSDFFYDYHPAPRRQYVVIMGGRVEVEVADGKKRELGPGDVLIADDLTGHGHIQRWGDEPGVFLSMPLTN